MAESATGRLQRREPRTPQDQEFEAIVARSKYRHATIVPCAPTPTMPPGPRKVELGSCGRPYGTPCVHEHACVRCPMLHVSPIMIGRLDELEADLIARRGRAHQEGWLGEIEGLDLTLSHLRGKREQTRRLARTTALVELHGPDRERRSDDVRGGEGVRGAERTAR